MTSHGPGKSLATRLQDSSRKLFPQKRRTMEKPQAIVCWVINYFSHVALMGISSYLKVHLEQLRNLDMSPCCRKARMTMAGPLLTFSWLLWVFDKQPVFTCPDHSQEFLLPLYPSYLPSQPLASLPTPTHQKLRNKKTTSYTDKIRPSNPQPNCCHLQSWAGLICQTSSHLHLLTFVPSWKEGTESHGVFSEYPTIPPNQLYAILP